MSLYVGPNLLHVHAVAQKRSIEAAAEKDRLLFQAGATQLPFGIDRLSITHVKPSLQTAIAGVLSFIARHRLPVGKIQAQPAS